MTRSVAYEYVSTIDMSKLCCFTFVLVVICLSLEADAQPTVDETMTWGSSTLEEVVNMVKEIKDEIINIKRMIKSGSEKIDESSRLENVVKEIKDPSKQALVSALVSEYLVRL